MGLIQLPQRARIDSIISAWRNQAPDFLWAPSSQNTLLLDQISGLPGRVAGNKPLGYGGLVGTVNNNGTDWIEFDTNVGIVANNTRFIGFALVSVPDASNASGCYLKIGSNANGLGFGFGGTTFENAGSKLILLREGIAWYVGTGTQLVNGLNVLSFGVAEDGINGITVNHNTTTAVEVGTGAASTASISAQLRINGYISPRGTGSTVHAVAIFRRSLTTTNSQFVNFRSQLSLPARQLDRTPTRGVRALFEPSRIWVPVSAGGGGDVSLALSGAAATTAAGNTSASITAALTGVSSTTAAGTVSATTGATAALTGVDATTATGTLAASISAALTGVSSTTAAGTLTAATSVALTGVSSTTAAGTLAASISVALTGVSSTAAAGTLSAGGDVALSVTGQAASATQGTVGVTVAATRALTGASSTAATGTLAAGISKALTGASATVSAGSLVAGGDVSVTITGQAVSTAQGTIGVTATGAVTVALTGAAAVIAAGDIFVTVPVVGWTPVDDSISNAWIPVDDSNAALWA